MLVLCPFGATHQTPPTPLFPPGGRRAQATMAHQATQCRSEAGIACRSTLVGEVGCTDTRWEHPVELSTVAFRAARCVLMGAVETRATHLGYA